MAIALQQTLPTLQSEPGVAGLLAEAVAKQCYHRTCTECIEKHVPTKPRRVGLA